MTTTNNNNTKFLDTPVCRELLGLGWKPLDSFTVQDQWMRLEQNYELYGQEQYGLGKLVAVDSWNQDWGEWDGKRLHPTFSPAPNFEITLVRESLETRLSRNVNVHDGTWLELPKNHNELTKDETYYVTDGWECEFVSSLARPYGVDWDDVEEVRRFWHTYCQVSFLPTHFKLVK